MSNLVSRVLASALLLIGSRVSAAEPFSGPHAEAVLGWNHVTRTAQHQNSDGIAYGGGFGYDVRSGAIVVGALTELAGSSGSSCSNYLVLGEISGESCSKESRSLFAGGRLGFVMGNTTLLYALGGYANVRQTSSFRGQANAPYANFRDHRNLDGYRVGAGVEHALSKKLFLKAEYRYTDVKDRLDTNQHQAVLGFGFRF